MKSIKEIFNKEMVRVFKDKKMVFSVFFLPVIIMIGIMYLMSQMITGMEDDITKHKPIVYVQNEQESFEKFLESICADYKIYTISESERADVETKIRDGEADLLIEFPKNMDEMIQNCKEGDPVPQIKTYYNPSEEYSNAAYKELSLEVLEAYRQTLLTERVGDLEQIAVFTVNSDNDKMVIQDEQKASGKALGMMLPYFITILLFAGAMGIGTDMIAGEKERGTMASLLVAPIKRSSIVLGKVFAGENLNISLNANQIAMLAVLLIGVAFLYSTMIALTSVFAKTIKEATTYVMPLYMVVLVVGLMTMFATGNTDGKMYYIPVYNISLVLKGILSHEVTMAQYGVTVAMTFAIGFLLVGIIVKAFESEKVMAA